MGHHGVISVAFVTVSSEFRKSDSRKTHCLGKSCKSRDTARTPEVQADVVGGTRCMATPATGVVVPVGGGGFRMHCSN